MIARDEYLKHLIAFKDKPVVKVITGIRRCGKSTLLMLYADWLKKNGVESKQIISINLESARYDNVKDYKTLYNEVASKIRTDEKYYVLLDEVQNVAEFERAVERRVPTLTCFRPNSPRCSPDAMCGVWHECQHGNECFCQRCSAAALYPLYHQIGER